MATPPTTNASAKFQPDDLVLHVPTGKKATVIDYLPPPFGLQPKVYQIRFLVGGTRFVEPEHLRHTGILRVGEVLSTVAHWMQIGIGVLILAALLYVVVEQTMKFFFTIP